MSPKRNREPRIHWVDRIHWVNATFGVSGLTEKEVLDILDAVIDNPLATVNMEAIEAEVAGKGGRLHTRESGE